MAHKITATEAARTLSEVLNRVRYKSESFVIVRNGEEVGILTPISHGRPGTVGELVARLREIGAPDERFAADLEDIRRSTPPLPEEPWGSS